MKKNALLVLALLVIVILAFNSFQKIAAFRGTSNLVSEEEQKLAKIKQENEALKQELAYKQSDKFKEEEIRNKLGMAKEGEEVVVIPNQDQSQDQVTDTKREVPNWKKWQLLFFGKSS